jgi:uncharacterized protein
MVTQQTEYKKPLPRPTPVSAPFWVGAKQHRLLIQRCRRCANVQFYPRPHCVTCLSDDLDWIEASGRGTLYSYTIVRRAASPAFEPDLPYVVAVIELAEGPHMTGNVVGVPPEEVRVGMPVRAVFDDVTPEVTLIKWRPD